ncbi:unnamed protein product [Symbiodinium natans]|uniref:Uncharacterized protein n=1 Tax=Symbiodinium natans TaxID=878477 RepID=A0A812IFP4_9DINO|nr:unnamed protein product [Symbiodinium natans]
MSELRKALQNDGSQPQSVLLHLWFSVFRWAFGNVGQAISVIHPKRGQVSLLGWKVRGLAIGLLDSALLHFKQHLPHVSNTRRPAGVHFRRSRLRLQNTIQGRGIVVARLEF